MASGGPYQNVAAGAVPVAGGAAPEGPQAAPFTVTLTSTVPAQAFNYPINAPGSMSQVQTIEIDNSQNSNSLTLVHGAANQTTIIPAFGGGTISTCSTRDGRSYFFDVASAVTAPTKIGVLLLNYYVPPSTYGTQAVSVTNQPTSGSDMILLNTLTAANSSSLFDTTSISSAYSLYDIVFDNILGDTSGAYFGWQAFVNGALQTGANYAGFTCTNYNGGANAIEAAGGTLGYFGSQGNILSGDGLSGRASFRNPLMGGRHMSITGVSGGPYGGSDGVSYYSTRYAGSTLPVTGLNFIMNSGKILSGSLSIWGTP